MLPHISIVFVYCFAILAGAQMLGGESQGYCIPWVKVFMERIAGDEVVTEATAVQHPLTKQLTCQMLDKCSRGASCLPLSPLPFDVSLVGIQNMIEN